jgi:hypothetical protein
MILDDGASAKTVIYEFCMGQLGYKIAMAYTLHKEARETIDELFKESSLVKLEMQVAKLETIYESALANKERKLAVDILKELNRLGGLYNDKMDITSGGEKLSVIVNIIKPDAD